MSIEPGPLYTWALWLWSIARMSLKACRSTPIWRRWTSIPATRRAQRPWPAHQRRLIDHMRSAGHPFTEIPARQVNVDHAQRTMEITLALEPGPQAGLGPVDYDGLERTDARFPAPSRAVRAGARYSPERIDDCAPTPLRWGIKFRLLVVPDTA